jgi:hypothetical protein
MTARQRQAALVLLAALGLATAARAEPGAAKSPAEPPAATRAEDRVIFDAEAARKQWPSLAHGRSGFWTPTVADVLLLEEQLPSYLKRELKDDRGRPASSGYPALAPLWKRAPSYLRQYVGFWRRGRRVIYGNFLCDNSFHVDWHTTRIDVDDGGNCYFQVSYDVKDRRFFDLMVNGEA